MSPARHVVHDEGAGLRRVVERRGDRGADRRRRQMRRPDPGLGGGPGRFPDRRPPASRRVAEVTSKPCAGAASVAANGTVGSSQWRCSPTSHVAPAVAAVEPEERHVAGRCAGLGLRRGQLPQHRLPGLQRVQRAAGQRAADRLDAVAGGGVHVLRLVVQPGEQAFAQAWRAVRRCGPGRGRAGRRRAARSSVQREHVAFRGAPGGEARLVGRRCRRVRASTWRRTRRRNASVGLGRPGSTPSSSGPFLVPGGRTSRTRGSARAACKRGVQRGFQVGAVGDQFLDPARAGRGRATGRPRRPAASGAVRRSPGRTGWRRTRRRRRRTRGGPRRTRSGSARRCRPARPTPPGSSPGRGWRPPVRRCGRGGWCARRSSGANAVQAAWMHSPRRSARRRSGRRRTVRQTSRAGRRPGCRRRRSPAAQRAIRPSGMVCCCMKPAVALLTASSRFSRHR